MGWCAKRALLAIGAVAVGTVLGGSHVASAGTLTGGATEITQALNNVALLTEIIEQGKQLAQLIQQAKMMKDAAADFKNVGAWTGLAQDTYAAVQRTRALVYRGQSLHDQWAKTHPGMSVPATSEPRLGVGLASAEQWGQTSNGAPGPQEHSQTWAENQAYKRLDDDVQRATSDAFKALDMDAEGVGDDDATYKRLAELVNSADGQLKVAKVTARILLEMLRQQHRLHDVVIVQARMMGEHISAQAQTRQFDGALKSRTGYTGKWSSKPIDLSKL